MTMTFDAASERPQFWRLPEVRRSPRFFRSALDVTADNWRGAPLTVALPSGHALRIHGEGVGPGVRLDIRDFNFIRRILASGDIGFAEGFVEGDWDTPDLAGLLVAFSENFDRLGEVMRGNPLVRVADYLSHALRNNSRAGSKKNIHAHYDLGNGFYGAWLDPSMTYSAAIFDEARTSLEQAQGAKYRALSQSIGIESGHNVLEIGCGWGGFAEFVGREIGARVEAVTISKAQHDYAAARIQAAGLSERVKIRLCDYRDVQGKFDRVASIEMFEAVGEAYWPTFFARVQDLLKPGGLAGLQVITIADHLFDGYRRRPDFIQKYIFPGGMLPSDQRLREETRAAGLAWLSCTGFASDYARTLGLWASRFQEAWPDIEALGFDERFRRLWLYYLGYCEAGFATGRTDVVHLTLKRA